MLYYKGQSKGVNKNVVCAEDESERHYSLGKDNNPSFSNLKCSHQELVPNSPLKRRVSCKPLRILCKINSVDPLPSSRKTVDHPPRSTTICKTERVLSGVVMSE